METPHTETVVDKAVTFMKDLLGIHPASGVRDQRKYRTEVTRENATHLRPRVFGTRVGELDAGSFVRPLGDPEDERLRRVIDEQPRERIVKLNLESGRVVDGD
jgi:hypothetical protein